jgi:hypothetical protein
MENTEENRKQTVKIQKKSKLNCDKIWKIQKKIENKQVKYRRNIS